MSKRFKFSRYAMYNKIEEKINTLNLKSGKCLIIGDTLRGKSDLSKGIANRALIDMLPKGCDIIAPPFPDVDVQDMPYEDNIFDYVLSDVVLEHVRKPWIATEEIKRVMKPKGLLILTTCLMHGIHGVPYDYFRFTPDGLKVLFEDLSIIDCDGQGDLNFVVKCMNGKYRKPIVKGSQIEKEALVNDGKNFLHVWIIAKK